MTSRGRPREIRSGNSASSRVRLTPVRRAQIDAQLFAKALIAAQLHQTDATNTKPAGTKKEKQS
jgi:hypothetical protein